MGSSCTVCSKDEYDDEDEAVRFRHYEEEKYPGSPASTQRLSQSAAASAGRLNTVAMLASMAHQAGGFMNQMAQNDQMDACEVHERVRQAKAQMRTVSVRNDCLYIDYEFVGRVPPNMGVY